MAEVNLFQSNIYPYKEVLGLEGGISLILSHLAADGKRMHRTKGTSTETEGEVATHTCQKRVRG
jgi:hypothetical protein